MEPYDDLPEFELLNQNNESVRSAELLGVSALVIYFYPKDDSPGCTVEACAFRDQLEAFAAAGVSVFGISVDSIESHKQFAEKHQITFDLLSDPGNKVRKEFGVPRSMFGLLPGRVTYVFNKEGKLIHQFSSLLKAEKHITEALAALR